MLWARKKRGWEKGMLGKLGEVGSVCRDSQLRFIKISSNSLTYLL